MDKLIEWLKANKIQHNIVDNEVVGIPGFGLVFFQDNESLTSIFKKDADGEYVFNCVEQPSVLMSEGINYVAFQFGNNWYYTDLRKPFALNILKYVGNKVEDENPCKFVNLGVHTPFELLNGSFMPKDWIHKAKWLGHSAIGVCDKNTMASLFMLQKECQAADITPVFGYSLKFTDGPREIGAKVYVQSQEGLRHLLRIQKAIMVDSNNQTIAKEDLMYLGGGNVLVFDKLSAEYLKSIVDSGEIVDFRESFDDIYFQVDLSEYKAERFDIQLLNSQKLYFDCLYEEVKPVMLCDCYYLDKDDAKNKIILNKIATGAAHEQSDDQYFKDSDQHYQAFASLFDDSRWDVKAVFEDCCASTLEIAEKAKAKFETSRNFMPKYDMTDEEKEKYGTPHNMFNELLEEGLQRLAPPHMIEQYRKQMEYEKYIIESTNNVDYLLVQYDTVNWCRRNDILVGCGRGSAAGSLLLYLLGITLVDPIKYDLIFERFLLPERAGLYPAETTIIGQDIESSRYIELTLENGVSLKVDVDSELMVMRPGEKEPVRVYADELRDGDNILFDNKDELFTLHEI